jgi:hypothetical protein
MNWLQRRLSEPSTHASLATGLTLASLVFPQYAPALQPLAAAFVGVGAALPEANPALLAAATDPTKIAAFIPPVHMASNPALAEAINAGLQAAITHLLTPPAKK